SSSGGPSAAPTSTSTPAVGGIGEPPADPGAAPVLDSSAEVTDPSHVFDVVIRGGRVMDPDSGFDGLVDVGVDGGRVTRIGPGPLEGRAVVDAAGHVVAPGFIDILSYAPNGYGEWYKIADGITTNLGMHGLDTTAADFCRRWDAGGAPVHFGGASDNAHLRPSR